MTYCVAMALNQGLVFAADSRTSAGVDHISTYRKLRLWQRPGERVLVMLSAGNLAITQAVAAILERGIRAETPAHSLMAADSMYSAARMVGAAVREIHRDDAEHLRETGVEFNVSLILGGQIKGEAPRLFMIYAAGNFIEATAETPYFQIGETKYGKPIIDRVVNVETDLIRAAKCALLSLDSTIRSNMTVGLPIDLALYRRDALRLGTHQIIREEDPYFNDLHQRWGKGLNDLFQVIPDPPWVLD